MGLDSKQQEQLLSDVADIKRALIGDKTYGTIGVVDEVKDLQKWKAKIDGRLTWVGGAVWASWFFICAIAYVGFEWVKTKFEK